MLKDFARWTLVDVEELHRRFKKTFGFAVTASQFESLLLLKIPESVGVDEIFEVLDNNRDGRVDGLELLAALACVCRATFEDKARFTFDLFDFNHNGSLSLAELALLMKSVLIGMSLLTGESSTLPASDNHSSMEAMLLCLGLAEDAFSREDKAVAVLGFEDFIAWARSNREFMLQVERFRLIAEKAVGFEDARSLPDGSDADSDLDVEDWENMTKSLDTEASQLGNNRKRPEIPPPWMVEPLQNNFPICKQNAMPPPSNLQLEWVYGTSGPSARNACRLLATGEAVYFVGSYVVLYSSERHEQRYYRGHRRAIGCLDANASGEIVATGDACSSPETSKVSAEIHVWNARSLQCLAVLRNFHLSGVSHVSFPAAASAATATLRQTQALSLGERSGAGGNSAVLSSNLMKKKPQETEALLASIGSDKSASMALWNWQKEVVVASGRAHPATRTRGGSKRPLALALNEDGDELVVVGAHFVVFHHVGGRFFKHKKPHWHGTVDPPLHTVPVCLSAVYYGIQKAVVGTARGELLLFERHTLTRCIQAHDPQASVNVCLLSCQSMVLFSAGKDGQIKQWDSTLLPIGQSLDLHASIPSPEVKTWTSSTCSRPENVLEGDDFRICSLDYDAQRRRFLVATRAGNILEIDEGNPFRWNIVASGHTGQPTRNIATASTIGGCFASCGIGERFVKLWSLRRRAFVQNLRFPTATAVPSALAFTSDGERLAVGSEDGSLMLARKTGASNEWKIEVVVKNTSSAAVAVRFGPLKTEPLLAVARDNGLVYLYRFELGGRRLSRWMLLKPQASDNTDTILTQAHALDFSIDGAFLRTQHGNALYFWDLRQRAGTRVTSMAVIRNVQWYTHSSSIGWEVGGLNGSSEDCVVGNPTHRLTLNLNACGNINLLSFPCPPVQTEWLSRCMPQAHLTHQDSLFRPPVRHPSVFGDFALRGSLVLTSSQFDPAICQWRVEKELADVQPRPPCNYDDTLRKRLRVLGLRDIYFDYGSFEDEEGATDNTRKIGNTPQALSVRDNSESSVQRSEAPDLALSLSYVYGMNHRCMSVNQSLACLGNGSYVYGAGPMLIVRHLHSLGARQRIVPSGLQHSVSCLVKHPSEPVLAVGSRRDDRIVLLRTEKAVGDSFQQISTLKANFPNQEKQIAIAMDFYDASDSRATAQSDLAAVIWKSAHSHVHTLQIYAWKRQLVLTYAPMTRMPVLFGRFTGILDAQVTFVSGGIDHVTFWRFNPATGHITAQQGVFGRHALVQTMLCGCYVPPFVVTGGEDGCVVLWDDGVAAHTIPPSSTSRHSAGGDGVIALEHLQASQIVLGALRNGSVVVWKYSGARSPTRGTRSSGRIQASAFLQLVRVIAVYDTPDATETYVQGMKLLDDTAVAALVLSNGEVLKIDLENTIETLTTNDTEKAKTLLSFSTEINDITLHPRDLRWASASADGHVHVWNLHTNLLLKQQQMPSAPRSLAWNATGEHLAVSLVNGSVMILDGATLESKLQFTCGDSGDSSSINQTLAKWCSIVRYSPQRPAGSPNWLALGCRDYNIYVYAWEDTGADSAPVYSLRHTFVGHTAPIEALDFSSTGDFLQSATSSNDRQLLRWTLNAESNSSTTLPDNEWESWTSTFAGPVEGLVECCGFGKVTALSRINIETLDAKTWSSPFPTMIVGLDDGHLMLSWYPLTRGDVTTTVSSESDRSSDPAVATKEYMGYFSRGSLIRRVMFSFANAFVVALARNSSGSTQVAVWKTDYEDELRLRQRFAMKSIVSLENEPNWYLSPVDRTLLENCVQAKGAMVEPEEDGDKWIDTDNNENSYLEFVYGLNPCATASRNVFYADDAWEIVYAAGTCGVVYNTKTQTQLLNYKTTSGRLSVISALAVHPKGDLVATGECLVASSDQKPPAIVIWDANSGSTVIRVASKHRPGVLLLDFSPDGHRLASIGMESDHTLAIYAITGGQNDGGRLRATLVTTCKTSTRRVWALSCGEDGDLAVCGDRHILFWRQSSTSSGRDDEAHPSGLKTGLLTSHKECNPHATLLQAVHMSGRVRVVVSSQADGSLYVWKDRVCVVVRRDAHGDAPIPALAVDQKQSLVYSAGADARVCVWNAQLELIRVVADIAQLNGDSLSSLPLISTELQSLAVRDGHVLFTTAGGEICELVETGLQQKTQEKNWRLHVHVRSHAHGQLCGLAVHPCKRAQFATAGDDGVVRLWDAATRSLLAFHRWNSASEFATGSNELRALAFSADGKHVAVGTVDGAVRVLTAALDAVVTQWSCWPDQQQGHAVLSLQYSSDGKLLAVGTKNGAVHVYNAASYRKVTMLRTSAVQAETVRLDFARDRPVLCIQCDGSGEQFWELFTWKLLTSEQVRDALWESKRFPSLVNGTTQCDDFNGAVMAADGHATSVTNWAVTKNERFLLSTGSMDRAVCQFRLPPRSSLE
ncbi:Echinoderm microtubule-associated protein-like 5 [Phytophthora citrophthora]|uniref:Echinoderm microtubule-associated protein-like 5 n=1 Tax=Phytophthora citrophthora TaxID=4793 RepID=A0AAD9LDG3_9STRA|nr:Echinoderm microtubule-associated protein-like 5 [Phytophthora citrophthora]